MSAASEQPAADVAQGTSAAGSDSSAEGAALYRQMSLIRRFEEQVQRLFMRGEVHGTTHLYIGEEAGAVGVAAALGPEDRVAGTYRGHGHALALGVSPEGLMAEMLGRATGVCGGRAGSMNVIDRLHRLIGCFGIVGGSIAAATGAALALQRTGGVAVAFFGEGTTNHGYFHECLNFAAVRRLPILYVCENNLYGEFTPFEDVTAGVIQARPEAMEIPSATVDGNDVWAVCDAARSAVAAARAGGGPQFLQSMTYRFVGHSRSDPGAYRRPGELDEARLRDPLLVARRRLIDELGFDDPGVDALDGDVDLEIARITDAALAAPYPDPAVPASEFKAVR